ncbi:MAG TPA: hypothetical protein VI278_14020 [Nitrososphaeraceae archaeon]
MSATILNHKAFCRSVGLSSDDVMDWELRLHNIVTFWAAPGLIVSALP